MELELVLTKDSMQRPEGADWSLPQIATEMGAIPMLPKNGRRQHVAPVALVTKNPAAIKIRSDQLTYRILLGLLEGKYYTQVPTHCCAEYRQTLPKGRGYVILAFSPRGKESWRQVQSTLALLGDEMVDTFLALLAVALDSNGTERISLPFEISVDDILALCQKKKSKGSYPAHQRLRVIEYVQALARVSVRTTFMLRDGKQWYVESPVLEVLVNEWEIYPGHKSQCSWQLKIGDWAVMLPQLQSQTSVISRQVLHYHARKQKYQKRLGRYLTVLYRINAHRHGGRVKVSMGMLLEHAGIALDRDNPGRTRDAIERALDQLHADGVIGSFGPSVERSSRGQEVQERIEQHAYHWWDTYRRQLWLFELPAYLKAAYQDSRREHQEGEKPD